MDKKSKLAFYHTSKNAISYRDGIFYTFPLLATASPSQNLFLLVAFSLTVCLNEGMGIITGRGVSFIIDP